MPCQDGGPTAEEIRRSNLAIEKKLDAERDIKRRLDLATRLLCDILTKMEDRWANKVWNPLNWGEDGNKELREWWAAHKEADLQRRRIEVAARLNKKENLRKEIDKLKKELDSI